jgi:serine/threonine protein kinase
MNKDCKIDNFNIIEEIGKGEYGIVYKARHNESKHLYALKQIDLSDPKEGVPSTTIREIALLKDIDHPNIIKLYNVIHFVKKLYLVLEICSSDLKTFISGHKELVSISDAKIIVYQLLKGLELLDSYSIMHRDLKPQNILIIQPDNDVEKKLNFDFPVVKLADFGLARSCSIPVQNYTPGVVTLWYRAPELLLGYPKYNESIEIWSLGCIFFEILTKKALFTGDTENNQLKKIFERLGSPNVVEWPDLKIYPNYETIKNWQNFDEQPLMEYIPDIDELGYDLLTKMLQMNPKMRISTVEALEHKWFDDIREIVEQLYL